MSCPRTSPTAARFDGLRAVRPGIGLEGMAERAALMSRTDRKYLVPAGLAAELVHDLADDLHVLDIDRQRTFAYRSLYYDTPELPSYRTAAPRRRRRFKVRRREYVDAGTSFLEVKTRTGRGDTEKVREERRSEEHTSELQSRGHLVCRLLLEKKKAICYSYTAKK